MQKDLAEVKIFSKSRRGGYFF